MSIPESIFTRIEKNREKALAELTDLLRIPSVSTAPEHAADTRRTAEWLRAKLAALGMAPEIRETGGHPVVFGQRAAQHPGRPTLLLYGHYDVQPPEPLEEWLSPPFSPEIREGYLFGRGATDDKGQLMTWLAAIEAVTGETGGLPVNVRIILEGEEEIGSPNLPAYLDAHREELAADAVAISDGSQFAPGMPAVTYGLRGLCYLQVDVRGPRFDLHSGGFGGVVTNPAQALAEILVRLKNPDGTVAIPGFYDDVLPLEPWEREEMAHLPLDEAALMAYLGVETLVGEPGYSPLERKCARPTLDVNGIWGGFQGEGAKTIIPARASAKVSMRLVPDQTPKKAEALFREYVARITPPGVTVTITDLHGGDPVLLARDNPFVRAAERAIETGFGKRPVFTREGGSIPIVNVFKERLGIPSILLLGWGNHDDGAHSPNERLTVEDFFKGARAAAALLFEMGSQTRKG